MRGGERTDLVPNGTKSLEDAADRMGVGRRSVARVRLVREMSGDDVLDAVERGDVTLTDARSRPKQVP